MKGLFLILFILFFNKLHKFLLPSLENPIYKKKKELKKLIIIELTSH